MAAKTETKYSVCTICDIGCQLRTETTNGKVSRVIAHDSPMLAKNICYKGTAAPHIHNHADRLPHIYVIVVRLVVEVTLSINFFYIGAWVRR